MADTLPWTMQHNAQALSFLSHAERVPALSPSDEGYSSASSPRPEKWPDNTTSETGLFAPSHASLGPKPLVAVIGVGYVGLNLVHSFSTKYALLGFDISEHRIHSLEEEYAGLDSITFTSNAQDLSAATSFLISVPTILNPDQTIDSSALKSALNIVDLYARAGSTVVIESSVAVSMTRQLLGPLAAKKNFFAGMSPERVDPGRSHPAFEAIPKVVSALDDIVPGSLDAIIRLYSEVFDTVVPVSKPEVAEMVKLYENCQRMMCIAYANEMADACIPHDIDPFEVCAAASTKPFGYMPYTPGLGVGGHCIPVNPYYLCWNNNFPLLLAAAEAMNERPVVIADRLLDKLRAKSDHGQHTSRQRPKVLVVGVGFKRGQSSLSNSPGLKLAKRFQMSDQVDVMFADVLVQQEAIPEIQRLPEDKWNKETLDSFSMIVVAFKQVGMDFGVLDHLQRARIEMWCP